MPRCPRTQKSRGGSTSCRTNQRSTKSNRIDWPVHWQIANQNTTREHMVRVRENGKKKCQGYRIEVRHDGADFAFTGLARAVTAILLQ